MKVSKRNGTEVVFDITKISAAITKANESGEDGARMTPPLGCWLRTSSALKHLLVRSSVTTHHYA